jgi:hypothetical protein
MKHWMQQVIKEEKEKDLLLQVENWPGREAVLRRMVIRKMKPANLE